MNRSCRKTNAWSDLYIIIIKMPKRCPYTINSFSFFSPFLLSPTWKMSVFEAFLVRVFPHSDWMRRDKVIQSECEKIRTRKTGSTETFFAVDILVFLFVFDQYSNRGKPALPKGCDKNLMSNLCKSFLNFNCNMDSTTNIFLWIFKCSPPEVFLQKDDLKI